MPRLVILARQLSSGGAQRQLVVLAKGLHAQGCDVHVVLFYGGGLYDAELLAAGVPVHFIGKRGRWDMAGFLLRLVRVLRALRPTVVYSFLDVPNILSVLLAPLIRRPVRIWSVRAAGMEMAHYDRLSRWAMALETWLSRCADVVIANSYAGLQWAVERGFPKARCQVVENGIDTQRFRADPDARARMRAAWGVGEAQVLVGVVGRLDAMKDHPGLLQAAAMVCAQRSDVRFVCVGDGPAAYAQQLQAQAQALGIAQRVLWPGVQQEMPAVYAALDVLCSSSAFGEGFPNVIGEAMACEVPCVVTDVGDSARIVAELGEVVPPRDVNALAAALQRMLARRTSDETLGGRARARVETLYSVPAMVARTRTIVLPSS